MKFLIDMPLSPELVPWLEQRQHEAVHALHLGLEQAPDEDLIARARQEGRVVITADLDFPRLLALAGAEGRA
jgi:predicted nuclease of predicted toxin-antitoxin system